MKTIRFPEYRYESAILSLPAYFCRQRLGFICSAAIDE